MARNTHDRLNDHFGTDLDTDSVLSASLPAPASTAAGQTIHQALLDIIANAAGRAVQMLPDNDANFTTTIGSWTHSAGTAVRDPTVNIGFGSGTVASLKFTAGAANAHIDLPIAGTFIAGLPYVLVLILVQSTDASNTITAEFGLLGTDSVSLTPFVMGRGGFAFYLRWTPSANRTGVSVRVKNVGGAGDLWVKAARLYQAAEPPLVNIGGLQFLPTQNSMNLGPQEFSGIEQFAVSATALILVMFAAPYRGSGFQLFDDGVGVDTYAYLWGEHTPGDFAASGFNVEVGADYVGLYVSEKDAGTIQIYADTSGGYDIELKDRGSTHFEMVTADGLGVAIPSMGMLPQYSAAPHSGTETEGESYFDTTLHKNRTWASGAWHDWW